MVGKSPVEVSLRLHAFIKNIQQILGIIAAVGAEVPVPLLIQGNINFGVGIMAFDSIIKQSYRLRVLPGIGHNVNILHIIPGRAHVHFISDNPVHHYAVSIVPVPFRQKCCDCLQIVRPLFFRRIKRIIVSAAASGKRMEQLRVGIRLIVQENCRNDDTFFRQGTEYIIILRHHMAIQCVILSVIGICNRRIITVRTGTQQPGNRDIIGRMLHPQIIQLRSAQLLRIHKQSLDGFSFRKRLRIIGQGLRIRNIAGTAHNFIFPVLLHRHNKLGIQPGFFRVFI